jgi:hypothetical protein
MHGPLISLSSQHTRSIRLSYYECSCILWNPKFNSHVCSNPQLDWTLSEMNPGSTLILSFLMSCYYIFLPSTPKSPKWPLLFSSSSQCSACVSHAWFQASAASWTLGMGSILCPETSVRNYHHSCDNPVERSSPVLFPFAVCVTFCIHLILPYQIALIEVFMQKIANYGGHRANFYIFLLLFLP